MTTLVCPSHAPPFAEGLEEQEQSLYHLPPLERLLLHWHRTGTTATRDPSVQALLSRREALLGAATSPAASLHLLCELAMKVLSQHVMQRRGRENSAWVHRPLPARLVRHAASLSVAETQQLLPPGVLVQKTVTLCIADHMVLCTGVGTSMLTRAHLSAIAQSLALPRKAVRTCRINPADRHASDLYGMQPGMVSPFLRPGQQTPLTALVVLPVPESQATQEPEVALSLSLWESLPLDCLPELVSEYAVRAYPAVPSFTL